MQKEYKILQTRKSISDAHKTLYGKLARSSEEIEINCGFPGGHLYVDAQYNRRAGFWWYTDRSSSQYWNIFGIGEPHQNISNSILVEINYPVRGINRRVGAALVKDNHGRIYVAHSGRLGGGLVPKGFKDHLRETASDGWIRADYGEEHGTRRFRDLFLISRIDMPDTGLAKNIAEYLMLVNKFKNQATKGRRPKKFTRPSERAIKRNKYEVNRFVRDSSLAKKLKRLYGNRCQICGFTFTYETGKSYSEAHHYRPLEEKGTDTMDNIVIVCPNHHSMLDYDVIAIDTDGKSIINKCGGKKEFVRFEPGHKISKKNLESQLQKM